MTNGQFDNYVTSWTPEYLVAQHIAASDVTLSGGVDPVDLGFLAYNFDPTFGTATSTPLGTAGTVYVQKLNTNVDILVSNLITYVTTANGTPTSGQNFIGLFNAAKARVGVSADQSTAWGTPGYVSAAITPTTIVAGNFYVAMFSNGTTQPAFLRLASAAGNGALSAANSRFATADASRTTTFPTSLGTFTAASVPYFVAVS